jgi:hypothetical protein
MSLNFLFNEPISGTQYQAIGGKPGTIVYQNPPFHPNILTVGGANKAINPSPNNQFNTGGGSLYRGLLIGGAGAIKGAKGSTQYRVNFLYNPSTISESRSIDLNSGVLPSYARNPDDPGTYATTLNTTLGFSLLFDRTFELWDKSYKDSLSGVYGVRVDIEAFYNLLGINQLSVQNTSSVVPFTGTGDVPGRATNVVQGPMTFSPVKLIFGNHSKGALSYFGYVSSIDITYTHFTSTMTPARCAVDVGFTVLSELAGSVSTG